MVFGLAQGQPCVLGHLVGVFLFGDGLFLLPCACGWQFGLFACGAAFLSGQCGLFGGGHTGYGHGAVSLGAGDRKIFLAARGICHHQMQAKTEKGLVLWQQLFGDRRDSKRKDLFLFCHAAGVLFAAAGKTTEAILQNGCVWRHVRQKESAPRAQRTKKEKRGAKVGQAGVFDGCGGAFAFVVCGARWLWRWI